MVISVANEDQIDRRRRQHCVIGRADDAFDLLQTASMTAEDDVIDKSFCDIHRVDLARGADLTREESRKKSRPRADISNGHPGQESKLGDDGLPVIVDLAPFLLKSLDKFFRFGIFKGVVDSGIHTRFLRCRREEAGENEGVGEEGSNHGSFLDLR